MAISAREGDVAHRLIEQLHFQAGLAYQEAAGAAGAKHLVSLPFEVVARLLAHHFVGADEGVGDGAVLELRLLEGGIVADERQVLEGSTQWVELRVAT